MTKFSFVGDISLNGNYESLYSRGEDPFLCFHRVLKDSVVVGNLECFARDNNLFNELKKPRLETSLNTLNYVKNFNLGVACLANNHAYDHLDEGFRKTAAFLKENNIKTIGASLNVNNYRDPLIIKKNGIKIGILNFVTKDTNPNPPLNTEINLNFFEIDKVSQDVSSLRNMVDHIVLCLHWGGKFEGGRYPDWDQPIIARKLIDAGVDLIIGHHSHTVQPFEVYKGKYIFYSLGNFCFSDFWFDQEFYPMPRKRMISFVLSVDFYKDTYKVETEYYLNNVNKYKELAKYRYYHRVQNMFFSNLLKYKAVWNVYKIYYNSLHPLIEFLARNDLLLVVKFCRIIKSIMRSIRN
jgi:poly-gamma-glutamate capsule biosynthesis protein CapA/YwtB (metallophosphatase superfamily)